MAVTLIVKITHTCPDGLVGHDFKTINVESQELEEILKRSDMYTFTNVVGAVRVE